jgi:uncharacterized membrane protein YczE
LRRLLTRTVKLVFGLFLYAVGIALTVKANIGYGPWEAFHVGLGKTIGATMGNVSIMVGLVIVAITLLMGEKIGIGTILNMLLIGIFLDLILGIRFFPIAGNKYVAVGVLILGLYLISLGSYFYIGSGFGAGPRDGLMVALTRRTRLPIGLIRGGIELSVTIVGWLLGGMVGAGTVIAGFAIGFCVQSTFKVLRFEPTKIRHSTIAETYKDLKAILGRA